jgi:F1F0 ATPase subunit 2
MKMFVNDWPALAASLSMGVGIGFAVGLVYFGFLWMTVQAFSKVRRPLMLGFASYLGRLVLALFAFYLLVGAGWERIIFGLAGFLLARVILVRRFRSMSLG